MKVSDRCRLLIHGPADGAWNMAVDELLLDQAAETSACCLRFYQWSRPTLSLGYFQRYQEALDAALAGCPVVRRATGGGALVHDRELTYSFTVGRPHRLAADAMTLYRVIHGSLVETLRSIGLHAKLAEAAGEVGREDAFLCFQRRTSGDVIVESSKICGSAQRRRRGGVLQHGGVLLAHSAAAPQLPGVLEVAGQALPAEALMELWLPQLRAALGVDLEPSALSELEQRAVERIVLEKHGNRVWIKRR